MQKLFKGKLHSSFPLNELPINVGLRLFRNSFHRTNYGFDYPLSRIMRSSNALSQVIDIFSYSNNHLKHELIFCLIYLGSTRKVNLLIKRTRKSNFVFLRLTFTKTDNSKQGAVKSKYLSQFSPYL